MNFFTIGYSGKTVEEFQQIICTHSIRSVIDIRESRYSHKLEFKFFRSPNKGLIATMAGAGVDYLWVKELGNPWRKDKSGWRTPYSKYLLGHWVKVLPVLLRAKEPTCLMCGCNPLQECHRLVVAQKLQSEGHEVVHL